MDFNDLNTKLKRLYVALGAQYDEDISTNIVDQLTSMGNGLVELRTSFGANSLEENQALVMNAIHAVASLKDIIKNRMRAGGQDPKSYEKLIDDNLSLSLITDLDNKDKHGDPLTQPLRSGRDPRITNIQQALRGKGITRVSFRVDLATGKTTLNESEGDVKIVVVADIVDDSGIEIMRFERMMEDALQLVEDFVATHALQDS